MPTNDVTKPGIIGSMSNWSEFNTDVSASAVAKYPTEYTIPELLDIIRDIKRTYDPKSLEKLTLLIEEHVHDSENPHGITLESMGTNVIAELYKEWTKQGYIGTQEDFLKVLFQYIEIADIPTTREGTSSVKLVSVKGAKVIYEDHLEDEEAHREMFRAIFPGIAPTDTPVWAMHAFVGPSHDLEVTRASNCYYHQPDGYLALAEANEIPIDYLYGEPMFSIWDKRKNLAKYSVQLDSGSFVGGFKSILETTKSPFDAYNAIAFTEITGGDTTDHGWVSDEISFEEGKVYTVSVYMLPINRAFGAISIPEEVAGENAFRIYDLEEDNSFTPYGQDTTINAGEAVYLNNGWVKLIHSFRAQATITTSVKCLFVDNLDGDTTYVGNGSRSGAMCQVQIEQGMGASPAIVTAEYAVERPATVVKIPFDYYFNGRAGTLCVEAKKPYYLQQAAAQYLYDLATVQSTLVGRFPVTHAGRLYMESFNKQNNTLNAYWTTDEERDITAFVHSYSMVEHCYGATGMVPHIETLTDESITYATALEWAITDLWPTYQTENGVVMVDVQNTLVASSTNVDTLSGIEVLTHIIGTLYDKTKAARGTNDVAVVDFLESDELTEASLLNDEADNLWIGCNKSGAGQYNGYIKSLVYYQAYSDEMNTEFHSGEYAHGL